MIGHFDLNHRCDPSNQGESGSESNDYERALHIPQSSKVK